MVEYNPQESDLMSLFDLGVVANNDEDNEIDGTSLSDTLNTPVFTPTGTRRKKPNKPVQNITTEEVD